MRLAIVSFRARYRFALINFRAHSLFVRPNPISDVLASLREPASMFAQAYRLRL